MTKIREALLPTLPVVIFAAAYFATTLLGNLLYLTDAGRDLPLVNIPTFSWSDFRGGLGVQYWLLLVLPFAMMPLAVLVGKVASPTVEQSSKFIPELSRPVYLSLTLALYVYAIAALIKANALGMFVSAGDAISAVENRFALLSRLGFGPQVVMKSLLVFLSIYGAIRAVRDGGKFWIAVTILNVVVLTSCLILLNMKWPTVCFLFTLSICVFTTASKRPFLKASIVAILSVITYLTLSTIMLRWFPAPDEGASWSIEEQSIKHDPKLGKSLFSDTAAGAITFAPRIFAGAINRMALAAPYYFDFEAQSGGKCAPDLSRLSLKRSKECEPTLLVYERMFRDDGFAGRGTAPAAINLYGYALAGWQGAVICTTLTMIVLGFFLALWPCAKSNSMVAAAFVMGSYTSYFFSQLPVEGPLIYDHGLWWALMGLFLICIYQLTKDMMPFVATAKGAIVSLIAALIVAGYLSLTAPSCAESYNLISLIGEHWPLTATGCAQLPQEVKAQIQ